MAPSTRSRPRQTIGATRARQGRLGRNILWVLLISLLLVVLAFFAAWTWKARDRAAVRPDYAAEQRMARQFDAPAPAAATRQDHDAGGPLAPRNQAAP